MLRTAVALYYNCSRIRKFDENTQTDRQTENSITEATLIPMDCRGERANNDVPVIAIIANNSK